MLGLVSQASRKERELRPFLHDCLQRLRHFAAVPALGATIPARYIESAPSPQNALDIFKGQWWSRLPEPFSGLEAGHLEMFQDARISWALSHLGDVTSKTVLELGPLEGGHSYMFERAGAASVIAIEANQRAYLKCLIVKEILGLLRTHFLCGDFVEYLRQSETHYLVCASGVLYHMVNPVELISLVSKVTDRLFLWTHYYDADIIQSNPQHRKRFTARYEREFDGFRHQLFRYNYWGSFGVRRFCGGSHPYAHWMRRDDIIACLLHFGFNVIRTSFDLPEHPDGPSFALVALRT